MLKAIWIKSVSDDWLPLGFDLSTCRTPFGVYVIWHGGQSPWTVRVGQGNVADRLAADRRDKLITMHTGKGGLWVTWATVAAPYLDGVERYLVDQLRPLVADEHPDAAAIPVNLPWAA